jgi:hypothetical protein
MDMLKHYMNRIHHSIASFLNPETFYDKYFSEKKRQIEIIEGAQRRAMEAFRTTPCFRNNRFYRD